MHYIKFKTFIAVLCLTAFSSVFANTEATFTMDWLAKGCVPVKEVVVKKGNTVEVSYTLCWQRSANNPDILNMSYKDYKLLKMNGAPAPKQLVDMTEKIKIPGFYVDRKTADFKGVDEQALTEAYRGIMQNMVNNNTIKREVADQMSDIYRLIQDNPSLKQQMEATVSKPWTVWVSSWVGTVPIGEYVLEEDKINLKVQKLKDGYFALELQEDVKPEVVEETLTSLISAIKPGIETDKIKFESCKQTAKTITKSNLQPKTAFWSTELVVVEENGDKLHVIESHEYHFGKFG